MRIYNIYISMYADAVTYFLSEFDASPRPLVAQYPAGFPAVLILLDFETVVMLRQSPRQPPLS